MRLTPDLLLRGYAAGIFPMAESSGAQEIYWYDPDPRGILPLDKLHLPRKLRKIVQHGTYRITVDTAFNEVLAACARPAPGREATWLSDEIAAAVKELHRLGFAHSVEAWQDNALVGGLYGIAVGGAFFGESMFSTADNASKVALVHLVARLAAGGFTLLDTQFVTAHLKQFGALEITRVDYRDLLKKALALQADFYRAGGSTDAGGDEAALVASFLQSTTQIS
jgi:leucyl/phenylalanyl-tRNA--protein transferase